MPSRVTKMGSNVTLQGSNVTLQGGNVTLQGGNVTLQGGNLTLRGSNLTSNRGIVTEAGGGMSPISRKMMMLQPKSRPKTAAERQAKRRAIKRGEWHTIPGTPCGPPNALPGPMSHLSIGMLPSPPPTPSALPAPAAQAAALPGPQGTAMQKAMSAGGQGGSEGVGGWPVALSMPNALTPGDASRLSLPPAVVDRLRSLLDRKEAGKTLTAAERAEARGLLDLAEYFVVQRLRQRFAA